MNAITPGNPAAPALGDALAPEGARRRLYLLGCESILRAGRLPGVS